MAHTREEKQALLKELDEAWKKNLDRKKAFKGLTKKEVAKLKFEDPDRYGIPTKADSMRYDEKKIDPIDFINKKQSQIEKIKGLRDSYTPKERKKLVAHLQAEIDSTKGNDPFLQKLFEFNNSVLNSSNNNSKITPPPPPPKVYSDWREAMSRLTPRDLKKTVRQRANELGKQGMSYKESWKQALRENNIQFKD
jgi:hypothetical protein